MINPPEDKKKRRKNRDPVQFTKHLPGIYIYTRTQLLLVTYLEGKKSHGCCFAIRPCAAHIFAIAHLGQIDHDVDRLSS